MKLIDQCCTLEQAKLLKSLGVKQDSIYFMNSKGEPFEAWILDGDEDIFWSAFTVAELSVMLPDYYPSWRFKVSESSEERKWITTLICNPKPPGVDDIHTESSFDRYGATQAEALATLLIALLETEAINVEEVNAICAE